MKVTELSSFIHEWHQLGGASADAKAPKLNAGDLAQIDAGTIPTLADGTKSPRALRLAIEAAARNAGFTLDLRAVTLSNALEAITSQLRERERNALTSPPRNWDAETVARAVEREQLEEGDIQRVLAHGYLQLLMGGELRGAAEFLERFSGRFQADPADIRAAAALGVKAEQGAWEPLHDIVAAHAKGILDDASYKTALKNAYLHTVGYVARHGIGIDDALEARAEAIIAFDPHMSGIEISREEVNAALSKAASEAANWQETRTIAELDTRLDFISDHCSAAELRAVFKSAAEQFIGSGRSDLVAGLERHARTKLQSKESTELFELDCERIAAQTKERLFDALKRNEANAHMLGILDLLRTRKELTGEQFTYGLKRYVEEATQHIERQLPSAGTAYAEALNGERAKFIDHCREIAAAGGYDWETIFPREKEVRIDATDIAAPLRQADYDFDTPALQLFVRSLIQRLPPQTTSENVVKVFESYLKSIEHAGREKEDRWNKPEPTPLRELGKVPAAELAAYAKAVASVLGKAMGAPFDVRRSD